MNKLPPHPATLRMVRAINHHYRRCIGCVYKTDDNNQLSRCTFPKEHHFGTTFYCHSVDRRHWIFIEKTDEANAAYAALILEHGVEPDPPPR